MIQISHYLLKKLLLLIVPLGTGIFILSIGSAGENNPALTTVVSASRGIERLVAAYPGKLIEAKDNEVVWCNKEVMIYDDKKDKSFDEKLKNADLEDQMSIRYPLKASSSWPTDFDPGRIRSETFFMKMYGSKASEVKKTLKPVVWLPEVLGRKVMVTTVNGVNEKLAAVSSEVQKLPKNIVRKVARPAGGFAWRNIRGTKRRSPHSYGIAIDLGKEYSDYWRWTKPLQSGLYQYRNRIPLEVVEIFERHGFIWGGKWYHFDTMHFEYRPELITTAP